MGNLDRSDDALGVSLALELRDIGFTNVWLESETKEKDIPLRDSKDSLIFLDAIDFQEKPGKIALLPLEYVFRNVSLSHRFAPFIHVLKNREQLKRAYVLGIQPDTLKEGSGISAGVRSAMDRVIDHLRV